MFHTHYDVQDRHSVEAIESRLMALAGQLSATEYQLLSLLDEFDQRGGWHGDGIKSFAHWLNWKLGMGPVIAREKVRIARALRDLPSIGDAFSRGTVSYSKVRAITRIATPTNESYLLQIAEYGTASQLERLCRQYKRLTPVEGDGSEARRDRFISWYESDGNMMEFRMRVPVEEAEVLIAAINRIADDLWRERQANEAENVSAEASAAELPGGYPEVGEQRVDALVLLAEQSLNMEVPDSAPVRDVVMHLIADPQDPGCQIADGPHAYNGYHHALEDPAVRRLSCDCRITPLTKDKGGNVLDIGRRSRVISPAMRLALSVRDRGCRFPGCDQSRWTDAHHVKHWIDGGETRLDNLITLCRHHHTSLHKGEYHIDIVKDGFRFLTRSNRLIPGSAFRNEPWSFDVPAEPLVSNWQGDSMDLDFALAVLQDKSASPAPMQSLSAGP